MSALCDDSMCGWTHSHCRRCKNEIDGKNTVTFNGSLYCTDCATKEQKRQEDMTMRFESSITAMGTPDNRWFKVSVEKSFRSEDEADTVADLVAAAPDMLEALKQARVAFVSAFGRNDTPAWVAPAMRAVDEAIAKAEGQHNE